MFVFCFFFFFVVVYVVVVGGGGVAYFCLFVWMVGFFFLFITNLEDFLLIISFIFSSNKEITYLFDGITVFFLLYGFHIKSWRLFTSLSLLLAMNCKILTEFNTEITFCLSNIGENIIIGSGRYISLNFYIQHKIKTSIWITM